MTGAGLRPLRVEILRCVLTVASEPLTIAELREHPVTGRWTPGELAGAIGDLMLETPDGRVGFLQYDQERDA